MSGELDCVQYILSVIPEEAFDAVNTDGGQLTISRNDFAGTHCAGRYSTAPRLLRRPG